MSNIVEREVALRRSQSVVNLLLQDSPRSAEAWHFRLSIRAASIASNKTPLPRRVVLVFAFSSPMLISFASHCVKLNTVESPAFLQ